MLALLVVHAFLAMLCAFEGTTVCCTAGFGGNSGPLVLCGLAAQRPAQMHDNLYSRASAIAQPARRMFTPQ